MCITIYCLEYNIKMHHFMDRWYGHPKYYIYGSYCLEH